MAIRRPLPTCCPTKKQLCASKFLNLFEKHPEQKEFFETFKNKTAAELRNEPMIMTHGLRVFRKIDEYVTNASKPELLLQLITNAMETHKERGMTFDDFEKLREAFVAFAKDKLGSQFTPEIEHAWNQLLLTNNAIFQLELDVHILEKRKSMRKSRIKSRVSTTLATLAQPENEVQGVENIVAS